MGKCRGVMVVSQRWCNPRRLQLPVPTRACRCDTEEGYCPHQHGRNLSASNSPNAIATVMLGEVGKISPSKSAGGDTGGLQHRHLPEFSTHNHQPDGRSRISPTVGRTHYRQRLSPAPRVHQQNVCSLC